MDTDLLNQLVADMEALRTSNALLEERVEASESEIKGLQKRVLDLEHTVSRLRTPAGKRVANTPELLEQIILPLTRLELIRARRVGKAFNNTIIKQPCPEIRTKLGISFDLTLGSQHGVQVQGDPTLFAFRADLDGDTYLISKSIPGLPSFRLRAFAGRAHLDFFISDDETQRDIDKHREELRAIKKHFISPSLQVNMVRIFRASDDEDAKGTTRGVGSSVKWDVTSLGMTHVRVDQVVNKL